MQFSKKADYALRAMAILSALPPDRTMQAQELAEVGKIPIKFLEQILLVLKRSGLLRSKRGVGGGYRLGRECRLISVADIVEAVDGELMCFLEEKGYPEFPGSRGIQRCLSEAGEATNGKLRGTSLEDLIRPDVADAMVGYGI
ncbi:MAG: Rrf2 family transcriptional regulator [Verrucomicrobiae bacterium]|nr:Rrf2 family transcriptional regulator [Verrucomicrobiae bacterium]